MKYHLLINQKYHQYLSLIEKFVFATCFLQLKNVIRNYVLVAYNTFSYIKQVTKKNNLLVFVINNDSISHYNDLGMPCG